MPQPTSNQVHVDAILTNISVAYMQKAENFIADKVFPVVPVDKQSDKYFSYTKNDWLRDEAQVRTDGTESVGSGYNITTDTYFADVFAIHKDVGDQTRANADAPINVDREAAEFVTHRLMLRREIQFVQDFMADGVWGTSASGKASSPSTNEFIQWSNYTTSDPIDNIEDGKQTILGVTGLEPNTLVLSYEAFRTLKHHPDLVDRIKYTSSQTITEDMLARMFDIDRVLVSRSIKATNNEGATEAYSFTQGKSACLLYVAPNPGLLTPSAGYTFQWTGVSGGLGQTIGTSSFRLESLRATRIESELAFDNKVVGADLGYFFKDCVA
jgi:hypothetical protein